MPRVRLYLAPADNPLDGQPLELIVERFPFVLGRHPDCDAPLALAFISRYHCSLFLDGNEVCAQDLNSRNGTYVNDRRALLPQVLHDQDHLRLGSLVFHVSFDGAGSTVRTDAPAGAGRQARVHAS